MADRERMVPLVDALPAILLRLDMTHPSVEIETIAFGLAILGAAFLLVGRRGSSDRRERS